MPGGLRIRRLRVVAETPADVLGRETTAVAHTIGRNIEILVRAGLPPDEHSVAVYHEVIEVAVCIAESLPARLGELEDARGLNEEVIEELARDYHRSLGPVSPENLIRALRELGF